MRDNGDVYVARSFRIERKMFGQTAAWGSIVALRDEDGDGVAERVEAFGPPDFDPRNNRRMQAPEYAGDGKTVAKGNYKAPLIAAKFRLPAATVSTASLPGPCRTAAQQSWAHKKLRCTG